MTQPERPTPMPSPPPVDGRPRPPSPDSPPEGNPMAEFMKMPEEMREVYMDRLNAGLLPPPIAPPGTPTPLQFETGMLDFLVASNYPDKIVDKRFPHIEDEEKIARARYSAAMNRIDGMGNTRENALADETRDVLGAYMTQELQRGIEEEYAGVVKGLLKEGAVADEELLRSMAFFRQPGEINGSLEMAIRLGFPNQITARNFPSLRACTRLEIVELLMEAQGNKVGRLLVQEKVLRGTLGYSNSRGDDTLSLKDEIEIEETAYRSLVKEYKALVNPQKKNKKPKQ